MKTLRIFPILCIFLAVAATSGDDRYFWLEPPLSEGALAWVGERNQSALDQFEEHPITRETVEIYQDVVGRDSSLRTRYPSVVGDTLLHVWKDLEHPRGLLQRISREDYLAERRDAWTTLLDIDALGEAEGESWVYKGVSCHSESKRCLLYLSPGGGDASQIREFDLVTESFVAPEDGGFFVSTSKSNLRYLDRDTAYFDDATSDASKTDIGYPNQVKLWKRGQALQDAKLIFEGQKSDVSSRASVFKDRDGHRVVVTRALDFYAAKNYLYDPERELLTALPFPSDVDIYGVSNGKIFLRNRDPLEINGKTYPGSSVFAFDLDAYDRHGELRYSTIFAATERSFARGVLVLKDDIYVELLDNVATTVLRFVATDDGGYEQQAIALPENGTARLLASDYRTGFALVEFESFLSPGKIFSVGSSDQVSEVRATYSEWDHTPYKVEQKWATSADGTQVPYFLLARKDIDLDGKNPTLLYGYGGFAVSLRPSYSEVRGRSWLDKGGVYALANIRGGGEFGPEWHKAALGKNRQRAFDDFIAVAEHLVSSGITSPRHLGIQGGSNGGLLVATAMTQRPDLFNAVVCKVPLLDMLRYTLMENAKGDRVGQSWAAEYGDPIADPEMRDYIAGYSPFQNLFADKSYPKPFLLTATTDDRVSPGHARKFAAKMEDQGHALWYYENLEGGHGGGADINQRALVYSMATAYLFDQLR